MSKKVHLVCNAHIDPVWQWEWEEGAAEAISTFRVAADFCDEYDGFVFNHNEALLYKWIEEYEPELFNRIVHLVKCGKWHIMGGWHLQPDCNMPSGEAFVRQINYGRQYFKEKFGVTPTVAVNYDPFGHTRGLVQIMKKSGYDGYLFMRPWRAWMTLPAETFRWVGYDGSEIVACRQYAYNTPLGKAAQRLDQTVKEEFPENGIMLFSWGVGDHGGGPSRIDLDDISELQKKYAKEGIEIVHSTPEEYFDEVKARGEELPAYDKSLNPWAVGCYTSIVRIKQNYRKLENMFFLTEKMASQASGAGLMKYPTEEFSEVLYDLLTVQFHDMLPGSSIQPSEDMSLRMLDHGMEILSRVKARAFFALAVSQPASRPDAIPMLVYNPHPYPVEGDFECEMMLWDQNRDGFNLPTVIYNGEKIPCQLEKENSNIDLDWRKKVVFHAVLAPMSMNRFECEYTKAEKRPEIRADLEDGEYFYLENGNVKARIGKKTGYMDRYTVGGKDLLGGKKCRLCVISDNCDPWGMLVKSFEDIIGEFTLLSEKEGTEFSGVTCDVIPSVRCIENGKVRTKIEAVLGYGKSRAVIQYTLSKNGTSVDISIRVQWAQIQKMLKFAVPYDIKDAKYIGQQAYGAEELVTGGRENCAQKYVLLENGKDALAVINDSTYGTSCKDNTLYLTLLRSAAYCAHPVDDPNRVIPQDRFTPHMDIGERIFSFRLFGGTFEDIERSVERNALIMNEKPMALSFYPPKNDKVAPPLVLLEGDHVEMTALKAAEDKNGYIVRLYNGHDGESRAHIRSEKFGVEKDVIFGKWEIKTLRLTKEGFFEASLSE